MHVYILLFYFHIKFIDSELLAIDFHADIAFLHQLN